MSGVSVVMMERWDAEDTLRLIEEHRVTHTHMVATMFHRLLQLPPDLPEPLPESVRQALRVPGRREALEAAHFPPADASR